MIDFFFSLGFLKRLQRTGWIKRGDTSLSDTVASHSFRTAIIGYYLAQEIGVDAKKVALGCLVHDLHEYLTGDLDPEMKLYLKEDKLKIMEDIGLEGELKELWLDIYRKKDEDWVKVVKDADLLETLIQALEENVSTQDIVKNVISRLNFPQSKIWAEKIMLKVRK